MPRECWLQRVAPCLRLVALCDVLGDLLGECNLNLIAEAAPLIRRLYATTRSVSEIETDLQDSHAHVKHVLRQNGTVPALQRLCEHLDEQDVSPADYFRERRRTVSVNDERLFAKRILDAARVGLPSSDCLHGGTQIQTDSGTCNQFVPGSSASRICGESCWLRFCSVVGASVLLPLLTKCVVVEVLPVQALSQKKRPHHREQQLIQICGPPLDTFAQQLKVLGRQKWPAYRQEAGAERKRKQQRKSRRKDNFLQRASVFFSTSRAGVRPLASSPGGVMPNDLLPSSHELLAGQLAHAVRCLLDNRLLSKRKRRGRRRQVPSCLRRLCSRARRINGCRRLRQLFACDVSSCAPIPRNRVFSAVRGVVRAMLGCDFCCASNRRVFARLLHRFLFLPRHHTLSLQECVKDFSLSRERWLRQFSCDPFNFSPRARAHLHTRFVCWLLMHVVTPLVRRHFYVTETGDSSLPLYFGHAQWKCIVQNSGVVERLFAPLVKEELLVLASRGQRMKTRLMRQRAQTSRGLITTSASELFSLGRLRLLPKKRAWMKRAVEAPLHTVFRPVVNYGSNKEQSSLQQLLQPVLVALKRQSQRTQHSLGAASSISNFARQYRRFAASRAHVLEGQPIVRTVVHFDIEKCYDSIDATVAERLCGSVLFGDQLKGDHLCFTKLAFVDKRGHKRFFTSCEPPETLGDIELHNDSKVARLWLNNAITASSISLFELFRRARASLRRNIVRFQGKFWRQERGIPQGGKVSRFLCDLFLHAALQRHEIRMKRASEKHGLTWKCFRVFDDFLLVIDRAKDHSSIDPDWGDVFARHYVQNLKHELGRRGLKLNAQKREVCTVEGGMAARASVAFIGLKIDVGTLQVSVDHGRKLPRGRFDFAFSVRQVSNIDSLCRTLNGYLGGRVSELIVSCGVNSVKRVQRNVSELCIMTWIRLRRTPSVNLSWPSLSSAIEEAVESLCSYLHSYRCVLARCQVRILAWQAVLVVFSHSNDAVRGALCHIHTQRRALQAYNTQKTKKRRIWYSLQECARFAQLFVTKNKPNSCS
ncbi:MAG: hypothetical protein MHM6MM_004915 [Cercozoa sp. M6MM]